MDPSQWSVSQVIDQLCNQTSDIHKQVKTRPILDLTSLEQALRANDIDGGSLLDLEDANIQDDLGIASFGQRREMNKIIRYLRGLISDPAPAPQVEQSARATVSKQKRTFSETEAGDTEATPEKSKRPKRIQPTNITSVLANAVPEVANDLEGPWHDLLRRYQHQEDDQILRPYGESDAEKEVDTDDSLYDELENAGLDDGDAGNVQRPSMEVVDAAIEEALQEFRDAWAANKKPKKFKIASRRWYQAARARTRRPQQDALRRELAQYYTRLAKFRSHVADIVLVEYTDGAEVKKNCLNLQATIEDIAEREYYLEVLESRHPPIQSEQPETATRIAVAQADLLDDEESLHSSESGDEDATTEDSSPLDEDDDMIVSDSNGEAPVLPDEFVDDDWHPVIPQLTTPSPASTDQTDVETSDNHSGQVDNEMKISPPRYDEVTSLDDSRELSPLTLLDNQLDHQIASGAPQLSPTSRVSDHTSEVQPEQAINVDASPTQTFSPTLPVPPNLKLQTPASTFDLTTSLSEGATNMDRNIPTSRYHHLGGSKHDAIMLSDSSSPISERMGSDYGIRTPPLLAETPTKTTIHSKVAKQEFPDIQATRKRKWAEVAQEGDAKTCLAKAVYRWNRNMSEAVLEHLNTMLGHELPLSLRACISEIKDTQEGTPEDMDHLTQAPLYWALFFVTWVRRTGFKDPWDIPEACLDAAYNATYDQTAVFHRELRPLLLFYISNKSQPNGSLRSQEAQGSPQGSPSGPSAKAMATSQMLVGQQSSDQSVWSTDSDNEAVQLSQGASHRKRPVQQNQESIAKQKEDQARVEQQEQRRKMMMLRFQATGNPGEARSVLVSSEEPPIYLDQHIAQRIKDHQITGVQFIWRELLEDTKRQGCLLAHTMGLGKTMQVISFLVTLAQCNKSSNHAIREKIPDSLRSGYTLVVCPASLVDNWSDELFMWIPHNDPDLLGPIFKLSTGSRKRKISTVREWREHKGVLLTSYETLRSLLDNKNRYGEEPEELQHALFELPSVVIADEAHKLKNARSTINLVTRKFKTLSRIALTGSPLNNHLEEYHTMVDWIAPDYLGSIMQFREKYSEPIERGLYEDSSGFDKRLSVKKLWVLKRDLAPKIDRKDISAIADDMPQKTEFFITVPLTAVQDSIYALIVKHILTTISAEGAVKTAKSGNAQLWTWLSILSWLDNHPACLVRKLQDRDEEAFQNAVTIADAEEANELPQDLDLRHSSIEQMLPQMLDMVKSHSDADEEAIGIEEKLINPTLSTRAVIAREIIEESIAVGDKVLLFSHSIPTLNYLQDMLDSMGCAFLRIDGSTAVGQRQAATKAFNEDEDNYKVFLISTRAGGLGLNLQGANRVIIYDFGFNPSWEEQAIGRAYRLGQQKPVYVYRFCAGGTYEETIHNKSVFKTQLFSRAVDGKNVVRQASKKVEDYIFSPRKVERNPNIEESLGRDDVLDRIIGRFPNAIRGVLLTETFQREDKDDILTADELAQVQREYELERLRRLNPQEYIRMLEEDKVRRTTEKEELPVAAVYGPPPMTFSTVFNPGQLVAEKGPSLAVRSTPTRTVDDSALPNDTPSRNILAQRE